MVLNDAHLEHLASSGLSLETLQAAGIRSVGPEQAAALGFARGVAGILFPYPGCGQTLTDGREVPHARLRVDPEHQRSEGQKYEGQLKSRIREGWSFRVYVPPGVEGLRKTRATVLVTEGEKKALKLTQEGFPALGLAGTWMFADPAEPRARRRLSLHPDLRRWSWRRREVLVCFDSDRVVKPSVAFAQERLCRRLTEQGACVRVLLLPQSKGKVGADDFLVAEGSEAFGRLAEDAPAWEPGAELLRLVPEDTRRGALAAALDVLRPTVRSLAACEREALVQRVAHRWGMQPSHALAALVGTDSGRPPVLLTGRAVPEIADDCWQALTSSPFGERLFVRGGEVVEVDDLVLSPVDEARLSAMLDRSAEFLALSKGEPVRRDAPARTVRDMLAMPSAGLPRVEGVHRLPLVDETGAVILSGVHRGLLVRAGEVPPPEGAAADHAAWLWRELLGDFPFVDAPDQAHALALLLLPLVRPLIDGPTPLHVIEAPSAGTGKSLLTELVAILATGQAASPVSLPRADAEVAKTVLSLLRDGASLIVFDNVNHHVNSGSLAGALTQRRVRGRVLGVSATVAPANNAVWVLTANNPTLSRELARRSVHIRLDASAERPWDRQGFRHADLVGFAMTHRAEVLGRLVALVQAWARAGRPSSSRTRGSFTAWSKVVGGVLEFAGVEGFLARPVKVHEDPEEEDITSLVMHWWESFGTEWVGARELQTIAVAEGLFDVVDTSASGRARFSRALARHHGRVVRGAKIERARDRGTNRYRYRLMTQLRSTEAPERRDAG